MHVLQLGPYPPPEGGINRNMLAIRDELAKCGHRCSIVATSRSSKITDEPDVHHPQSALGLLKLLLTIDHDVLHLHIGGAITKRVMALALVCSMLGRGKKVLSLHSGGYPTTKYGKSARPNSVRGWIFRKFDHVIAVNSPIADVFARYGLPRKKVHVISPFVHLSPDPGVAVPDALRQFIGKHSPLILTVGLLEPEYDLFMQIEAMAKVVDEFPDAGLMIVGSGSLEADVRDAIASKPYSNSIILAGDVKHAVTLHLINMADMLLRTTAYDGDAISVREALFLETPVIATDNDMRPEGVHLIPIHDKDELAERIAMVARSASAQKTQKPDDTSNAAAMVKLYDI